MTTMAFPISIHICRVSTASVADSSNTAVKNGATLNEFVARRNANKQIQMSSALNIEGGKLFFEQSFSESRDDDPLVSKKTIKSP